MCEQTLWNGAERKVEILDAQLVAAVRARGALPAPRVAQTVDLYAAEAEEVLVLTDAIGVKAQKPTRDKPGAAPTDKPEKRHDTDVLLLQKADRDFAYLMGSTDKVVSLVEVAEARLRQEWGERKTPLPVVALTDGARKIRLDLLTLFGEKVRIVLDWYHLEEHVHKAANAVFGLGSVLAKAAAKQLKEDLWEGRVVDAIARTRQELGKVRSPSKRDAWHELLTYLENNQKHMDYPRYRTLNLPIGSGQVEAQCKTLVGGRCKQAGMRDWTYAGAEGTLRMRAARQDGSFDELWNAKLRLAA